MSGTHLAAHREDGLREESLPSKSPTAGLIRGAAVASPALSSTLVPGATHTFLPSGTVRGLGQ